MGEKKDKSNGPKRIQCGIQDLNPGRLIPRSLGPDLISELPFPFYFHSPISSWGAYFLQENVGVYHTYQSLVSIYFSFSSLPFWLFMGSWTCHFLNYCLTHLNALLCFRRYRYHNDHSASHSNSSFFVMFCSDLSDAK